jgi:gluconolactonase
MLARPPGRRQETPTGDAFMHSSEGPSNVPSTRIGRRVFLRSASGAVSMALLGSASTRLLTAQDAGLASELPQSDRLKPSLYATGFALASGLALDRHDNLFVSNYRELGAIGLITKDGSARILCRLPELAPTEGATPQPAGLKVDGEGRLIIADVGAGRLLRVANDGMEAEVLADRCNDKRFDQPQDVALDVSGNIYMTDASRSEQDAPSGSVFLYSIKTGKVSELDKGLPSPSGLGVTPDQNHLCVADRTTGRILVYELSSEGSLSNRRELSPFGDPAASLNKNSRHKPSGFVFDVTGRMYVATDSGFVHVVDVSTGKIIRRYDAGGPQATSCHFRGRYLYTAVASKEAVFRLELGVDGFGYDGLA